MSLAVLHEARRALEEHGVPAWANGLLVLGDEIAREVLGVMQVGLGSRGRLRPGLPHLSCDADVLLLAGDLTRQGSVDEAVVLSDELDGAGVPVVAVLGNHDCHCDQGQPITEVPSSRSTHVLEGECVVIDTPWKVARLLVGSVSRLCSLGKGGQP